VNLRGTGMSDSGGAAGYPASYYADTARGIEAPRSLDGSTAADVCVIGAGYTGLSTALHLRERGLDVVLLEARRVGWGASGRNGGQVASGQRKDETELERALGKDTARALWGLAEEAKALVRELIHRHGIDCDLGDGALIVAHKPAAARDLAARAAHLQRAYQYDQARYVVPEELRDMLAAEGFCGGLLDAGGMHLHPLNYALGLARACRRAGVRLYEKTPVLGYSRNAPAVVRTRRGDVRATHVVVACNAYLERLEPRLAGRIMPVNNYMVATAPLDSPRNLIRDRVCVHDTRFVVNYFRLSADGRLLFGGGETYRRSFPADIAGFVRPYLLRIFPQLAATPLEYAWGGALAVTLSRLPHVGRLPPNVFFAHGFSGHGVPTATLAGKLIAGAIAGDDAGFERFAGLPIRPFPGGTLLRWPGLVAGMLWYAFRDRW
jgi:gamma-glutamylputrescine oxidase